MKSNAKKADTIASEQVTCRECGKFESHVLLSHLKSEHNMTGLDYALKHAGEPLFSDTGAKLIRSLVKPSDELAAPQRATEMVTVEKLFGGNGSNRWKGVDLEVKRYKGNALWVPPGSDKDYHYDFNNTLALLMGLHRERRNSVWISGYAGTGKTQLVLNVCRRLGREVIRVTMDSSLSRSDIIGEMILHEGETKFKHGVLPQAMVRGSVLLLDEFDLGNPYVVALFRPVLEEHPRLVIPENGGEIIDPHPDFKVIATANTFGGGDSTGLYGTTQTLSLADRQRFSLFIHMDYLKEEDEIAMLMRVFPEKNADYPITYDVAQSFVRVANKIREQFKENKIEESLSPRQIINWVEIYQLIGQAESSARLTFLLPMSESSQLAIGEIINQVGFPEPEDEEE